MGRAFVRALAGALAVAVFAACGTTSVEKKQRIAVDTDPPGAWVYVEGKEGRRAIGKSPTTIERPYTELRHDFSNACWLGLVGAVGLAAFGGYAMANDVGVSTPGDPSIPGILGLVYGGAGAGAKGVTCGIGASMEGDVIPQPPVDLKIVANTPGHVEQALTVKVPAADSKVALVLPPDPAAVAMARPAPSFTPPPIAAPPPAVAAGPRFVPGSPQPTSYALVIGVERYRDVPAPAGARADAERFAELARTSLGVPARNVILALDDRAAKSDLEKHLAWLEANVPPGGRVYLFFGGHGAPEPSSGTSYLLPYDADPAALDRTALKLSDVLASLGRTRSRDVVAFVDSCFSGAGGRSVLAPGTRPLVPVIETRAAPRVAVFTAASGAPGAGAGPGGGGLLTHFLAEGLGGAKADLDGDTQITLQELFDWVRPRVTREAKRESRDQTPDLKIGDGVRAPEVILGFGLASP